MSITLHKIIDGVQINLTAEEIAEHDANVASYVPETVPPTPTKEQLLAELQALTTKINALG
jgi:hypothetical protein